MKKSVVIILSVFAVILILILFSGFNSFTGRITKENIIISVSPQGEVNNDVFTIRVITTEKANCMYNLGIKNNVAFRYYIPMTVTGETSHSQLLKDLNEEDYNLGIKCTDSNNFAHTKDFDITIKIPETCVVYCEYTDNCDEYAVDGCGNLCKRDTDGIPCGENKACNDGFCIIKEADKIAAEEAKEEAAPVEQPVVIKKPGGFLNNLLSFLRGIFG